MNNDLGYQKDIVVFDLDDTLYKELDFVKSAFDAVGKHISLHTDIDAKQVYSACLNAFYVKKNPFDAIVEKYAPKIDCSMIDELVNIYRFHKPALTLHRTTKSVLDKLQNQGYKMGIITDGRSKTQHNKIEALKLYNYIAPENIIISEEIGHSKKEPDGFEYFVHRYPNARRFFYIGDNIEKDFFYPNLMGWTSICLLDNGNNIHSQSITVDSDYEPSISIKEFSEILNLITQ